MSYPPQQDPHHAYQPQQPAAPYQPGSDSDVYIMTIDSVTPAE